MLDHGTVRVEPITLQDLGEVGAFLHHHLNDRLSPEQWSRSILPSWSVTSPNHGFCLRDGERLVGVQLAFYAVREIAGVEERFCNLGAWCVLEEHRGQAVRLLRAVLAQPGYHVTDLSPSGSVVDINARLRFQHLDTTTALLAPLGGWWPGRTRVESDPEVVAGLLSGAERRIFEDHRAAAAALHVVLVEGDRSCYVMLRRDRRKGLPLFASVLHAGDPVLLRRRAADLGRHLLAHHHVPLLLVELRHVDRRPRGAVLLRTPRPKMFRSSLPACDIDDLYSELALVAW